MCQCLRSSTESPAANTANIRISYAANTFHCTNCAPRNWKASSSMIRPGT